VTWITDLRSGPWRRSDMAVRQRRTGRQTVFSQAFFRARFVSDRHEGCDAALSADASFW
jgi:hypothetical protein